MHALEKQIGIIGGGQLGKMMILEAKKLGFKVAILDPTNDCPAHSVADVHIIADFDDANAFRQLAAICDVLTYEFEHINVAVLKQLESEGYQIYPTAASLEIIQNKYTQKLALKEAQVPIPDFYKVSSIGELEDISENIGFPFMLKCCKGGYDGKGNCLVKDASSIKTAWEQLNGSQQILMAETYIPFTMEISVLACRSIDGNTAVYPVAQNTHTNSILEETIVPAAISDETTRLAMDYAAKVMNVFQGVGMFCVEMFVTPEGGILINEVAPRPHNSGHYTIEACKTSQFMQHIRAVAGLPLGSPALLSPVSMRNLLCEESSSGNTVINGLDKALNVEGANIHIYGKSTAAPRRKMGHITVCAETAEKASMLSDEAKSHIRIYGDIKR